jgi:hypothetical protein
MNELILLITGGVGAWSTYYVANDLNQGAIRSSAGLSLIVGLFFYTFPTIVSLQQAVEIPFVFMGASFVGMTAKQAMGSKLLIFIAGLIYSCIYIASDSIFIGYGGKIGSAACIAGTAVYGIQHVVQRFVTRSRN